MPWMRSREGSSPSSSMSAADKGGVGTPAGAGLIGAGGTGA